MLKLATGRITVLITMESRIRSDALASSRSQLSVSFYTGQVLGFLKTDSIDENLGRLTGTLNMVG